MQTACHFVLKWNLIQRLNLIRLRIIYEQPPLFKDGIKSNFKYLIADL